MKLKGGTHGGVRSQVWKAWWNSKSRVERVVQLEVKGETHGGTRSRVERIVEVEVRGGTHDVSRSQAWNA